MTSLRDTLLPVVYKLRGIAGKLGVRIHSVSYHVRSWNYTNTNPTAGETFEDELIIPLFNDETQNVKVRVLSSNDVYRGIPQEAEIEVTLTPKFAKDGYDYGYSFEDFEDYSDTNNSAFFLVKGEGFGSNGTRYAKINYNQVNSVFKNVIYLRRLSNLET